MTETTLTGVLIEISDVSFYFETDDGESSKVLFDDEHLTPIQKKIALKAYRGDDGEWHVDPQGDYYSVPEEPLLARAAPPGMEKKHIALFRKVDVSLSEEREAKQLEEVQDRARTLEDFWRRFGRRKWDVKVVGRTLRTESIPSESNRFCRREMYKAAEGIEVPDFEPNYVHMWSTHDIGGNWCGHAELGGDSGVTYGVHICNVKSTIHEIGHNFRLYHANVLVRGEPIEYKDDTCVMGSGSHIAGINSPNQLLLGLASEREQTVVERSAHLLVCPLEVPEEAMHEAESKHVIVKTPKAADTYISLRKGKGFPYLPKSDGKTLYLHRRDRLKKSELLGTVRPGESASLDGGVRLKYHDYADERARISLEFNDGHGTEAAPDAAEFPEKMSAVEPGPQHSGLWYDPDFDGQGFDVNVRGGKLSVVWYTFNENRDDRRFYFGTCDLAEAAAGFDLHTTRELTGTFEDPTTAEVIPAGRAQLYFTDDANGVFNFNLLEQGRGSVQITSLAASDSPRSGLWYQASRNKEGFSVKFFEHLDSCTAFWYTYSRQGFRGPRQRWFMCSGKKDGEEYNLDVYEVTGGKWLSFDPIRKSQVGTARLKVLDDDSIAFKFDVDSPDSITGSGEYKLRRLM
jgi:hypothetical protein